MKSKMHGYALIVVLITAAIGGLFLSDVIAKQMKIADRRRLDVVYDASLGRMPSKPYPREEAVALELESVAFTDPLFKDKKVSEFMDGSIIAELDRQGFFAQLQ